jgi:hypothetical protein
MTLTSDTETVSTTTAIVTVRVPRDSDVDVATDAEQRLSRLDGVRSTTVEGIRDIEPRFPVTIVTVDVTIDSTIPVTELRDRATESVSIDDFEPIDGTSA